MLRATSKTSSVNEHDQAALITAKEVSAFLRVSVATVRRWTNSGKLACYRIGGNRERRFSDDQVRSFLAQHEHPSVAS